jgi:hypothetical protein
MQVTTTPAAPRGTLQLACPVRSQVSQRLAIANPLPQEVRLRGSCTDKQVGGPARLPAAPALRLPPRPTLQRRTGTLPELLS